MSGTELRKNYMKTFAGLTRNSTLEAWAIVTMYMVQIALCIALGAYLLGFDPSFLKYLGIASVVIFIGTRLRGINNIVHECTHNSFADTREQNVLIGKFCSALLTGCFKKYKDDHLSHHSHLGDYEKDAEFEPIENLRLHDPLTPKTIMRHIITPLTGRHLPAYSGKNLSGEDGPLFFGLKIAFLVVIAAVTLAAPLTMFWFVLLPLFYVFPTINFWTDCLDHAGLVGEEDELRASRNVLAPKALRRIFFPRNDSYHLIHHLFPSVPTKHLDDAHKLLCNDDSYANEPHAVMPLLKQTGSKPRKIKARLAGQNA